MVKANENADTAKAGLIEGLVLSKNTTLPGALLHTKGSELFKGKVEKKAVLSGLKEAYVWIKGVISGERWS